jgi:hypothetical protein
LTISKVAALALSSRTHHSAARIATLPPPTSQPRRVRVSMAVDFGPVAYGSFMATI